MTSADHVLRRWAQAQVAAGAASHEGIQPPTWPAGALRWAKATDNWTNVAGHGSYVDCRPCADAAGTGADSDILLRIYLPRAPGTDPNVETDQVIGYVAATDGVHVAMTAYLDDVIGTIKMWAFDTADPPIGWTECISGGTPGRSAPTVGGLEGTFPVAKKAGDADFDTVGDTGNLGTKTHCHSILRDATTPPCGETTIDEGTWQTVDLSIQPTDHLPPWCVVRFIERYDNSA
jgi:hypothetical protein